MKASKLISRRNFIGKAAITAGLTTLDSDTLFGHSSGIIEQPNRLPREVWIATVSQQGISADSPERKTQAILSVLNKSIIYQPDIVCLPEVFMFANIRNKPKITLQEEATLSEELLKAFMDFSRINHCYLICPMFTNEDGKTYNSAVVIDRQGNRIGEYRKMYLPDDEVEMGLTPGPLQPPVFKADFGIFGIQICYDVHWNEAWKALRQQGAEIVFWPSAFSGGRIINTKAWQNKYIVVSSTGEISKICDISGEVVAQTGIWDRNLICAPVNLEKVFLHLWPFVQRFDEIKAKYGRKVRITNYHEEQWAVIESLSPDVRIKDILNEFEIRTHEQLMYDSELKQNRTE